MNCAFLKDQAITRNFTVICWQSVCSSKDRWQKSERGGVTLFFPENWKAKKTLNISSKNYRSLQMNYRYLQTVQYIPIRYSIEKVQTRGPKGHISCTWVQCATFLRNRSRQTFFFTHRPEKHKLGRERWDLASCQVSLNSVQRFQRRSQKCLSQSEATAAILFFWSALKHKLGKGHWNVASCKVSLNSV